jgi:Ca2+-transporting ATPase
MKRPPRDPREAIVSASFFSSVVFYSALLVAGTFAVMWWAHHESAPVTTMVFMTLALGQVFHLGNARSERDVLRPAAALINRYAIGAVVISCGLQTLPLYVGSLGSLLQVTPLSLREWLVVGAGAGLTAVVGQAMPGCCRRPEAKDLGCPSALRREAERRPGSAARSCRRSVRQL